MRETKGLGGADMLWTMGLDSTMETKNENLRLGAITHFVVASKRTFLRGLLLIESRSPEKEISYVNRPI